MCCGKFLLLLMMMMGMVQFRDLQIQAADCDIS